MDNISWSNYGLTKKDGEEMNNSSTRTKEGRRGKIYLTTQENFFVSRNERDELNL